MASSDLITIEEYELLMQDRPVKFGPSDVGFSRKPKYSQTCDACVHWFKSPAAKRNTCEIMRPDDGDENVQPFNWCRYWTADYKTFPLLEKE